MDQFFARRKKWRLSVINGNVSDACEKKLLIYVIHIHGCLVPRFITKNVEYWISKGFLPVMVITYSNVKKTELVNLIERHYSRYNYIIRNNKGKDFGGIGDLCRMIDLDDCDQIIMMNDSYIGPFYDSDLYEKLKKDDSDVIGITESYDGLYHLQSSFLYFKNNKSILSLVDFFKNHYKLYDVRENIIKYGEVGLSQYFLEVGLKMRAIFNLPELLAKYKKEHESKPFNTINSQHAFCQEIFIHEDFPYIKREFLSRNPMGLTINYEAIVTKMNSSARDDLNEALMSRI